MGGAPAECSRALILVAPMNAKTPIVLERALAAVIGSGSQQFWSRCRENRRPWETKARVEAKKP